MGALWRTTRCPVPVGLWPLQVCGPYKSVARGHGCPGPWTLVLQNITLHGICGAPKRDFQKTHAPSNAQFLHCGINENGAHEARKGYPPTGLPAGPLRGIKGRALLKLGFLKNLVFKNGVF